MVEGVNSVVQGLITGHRTIQTTEKCPWQREPALQRGEKFCLLQPDLYQMLKSRNQFYRLHIVECLVYISNKLIEWKEIQD